MQAIEEETNEVTIGNMFSLLMNKKIGSGSFGEIYKGINLKTEEEVAIKIESNKTQTPQLLYEGKILKLLQGGVGIPILHQTTTLGENTIMIIELCDKNLEELINLNSDKKFSLKTVLMIADQLLSRIEYIHSKNIIHRDIKPENFLIGLKKKSHLIYLIDFGLAKRYKDFKTGEHIPYLEGKSLTGTARYASVYTHLGIEQSRRDDLESIGYMLVYFLKGQLPWQGIKAKTKKEKYRKIMETKKESLKEKLYENLPKEFEMYFKSVKELQFDQKPDYQYLRDLFKQVLMMNQLYTDFVFDWVIREKERNINIQRGNISLFSKLNINVDEGINSINTNNCTGNNNNSKNELKIDVNKFGRLSDNSIHIKLESLYLKDE